MTLHLEYSQRHGLKYTGIEYCPRFYVFFKKVGYWKAIHVYWESSKTVSPHPGKYSLSELTPIHNGYSNGRAWHITDLITLHWEDLDNWMYGWFERNPDISIVKTKEESYLSLFEMFLIIYDDYLMNYSSDFNFIYEITNQSIPIDKRYKLIISSKNTILDKFFRFVSDNNQMLENYAYWIDRLV